MNKNPTQSPQEVKAWLDELFGAPEKEPLTPRQRVVQALDRQQPDRTPFDFWGVPEIIDRLILRCG